MSIPSKRPLAYLGIPETDPPQITREPRDPSANDYKNFQTGDIWLNRAAFTAWICTRISGQTALWEPMSGGTGLLTSLTGDDAIVVMPFLGNINVQGGASGAIAFTTTGIGQLNAQVQVDNVTMHIVAGQLVSSGSGSLTWSTIAVNTVGLTNHGYIANAAATVQLSLPAASAVGDEIVMERNRNPAGLWQITQAAGQQILAGSASTTLGAAGTLTATNFGDVVALRCIVANTIWSTESVIGNPTAL